MFYLHKEKHFAKKSTINIKSARKSTQLVHPIKILKLGAHANYFDTSLFILFFFKIEYIEILVEKLVYLGIRLKKVGYSGKKINFKW